MEWPEVRARGVRLRAPPRIKPPRSRRRTFETNGSRRRQLYLARGDASLMDFAVNGVVEIDGLLTGRGFTTGGGSVERQDWGRTGGGGESCAVLSGHARQSRMGKPRGSRKRPQAFAGADDQRRGAKGVLNNRQSGPPPVVHRSKAGPPISGRVAGHGFLSFVQVMTTRTGYVPPAGRMAAKPRPYSQGCP